MVSSLTAGLGGRQYELLVLWEEAEVQGGEVTCPWPHVRGHVGEEVRWGCSLCSRLTHQGNYACDSDSKASVLVHILSLPPLLYRTTYLL